MLDHIYKELYYEDSVDRKLIIDYDKGKITNEDLYLENFELTETLCSKSELVFGSCEASTVKFKIRNIGTSLENKKITISNILNNWADTPFQLGKYKVYSDVPSGDRNYRNIVAYDSMHDIINADVTEWYETLEFPMSQKAFRDSFFDYFGIEQEDVVLTHDDILIEKTITGSGISGKLVITCICELNGVFGHINREGKFTYISLRRTDRGYLYPALTLYPSETLYFDSAMQRSVTFYGEEIQKSNYISCEYEDFTTQYISKLQIRAETDDIGVIAGEGSNAYIIEGNFLVFGKTEEELQSIAERTLNVINSITYNPFKASVKGNPCIEVGDGIVIYAKNGNVESYVLERTIKGIQGLRDEFQASGVFEYKEKVNSRKNDIEKLKGKTNVLERTLDKTRSEITDIENGLNTKFEQTTEEIKASVQRVEKNTNESLDSVNKEIETLTRRVEVTATAEDVRIEIQKELDNGITKVVTNTGYVFGDEGLDISRSDSEISTKVSHDGMNVKQNGETVLAANSEGVEAKNLHATTYLIIGSTSRFEDYEKDGEMRTGCFWIGE